MSTPWLHVIGVTEAGLGALPPDVRALVEAAETVLGPPRLLPAQGGTQNVVAWTPPLAHMIDQVLACRGNETVVLATGDPNWFGIGVTLLRHLQRHEFEIVPQPSSLQLAAARLHWPVQNVTILSFHGRSVAALHPHILPSNRILALTGGAATLQEVAGLLTARGYGDSVLTVLEHLGGSEERLTRFAAHQAAAQEIGAFYVLAIDCVADAHADLLPTVPGLPDHVFTAFAGQLTKREVRAATLAKLMPFPGALLWDVGAGSGSVGIEWMRAARDARAICFERDPERAEGIAENRNRLGVPGLDIVIGEAPQSFAGQPDPDTVFLGGEIVNQALFTACWERLKPGGLLVANAVTLDSELALNQRQLELGGELTRIEISSQDTVGRTRVLRPRMAVLQWQVRKGTDA